MSPASELDTASITPVNVMNITTMNAEKITLATSSLTHASHTGMPKTFDIMKAIPSRINTMANMTADHSITELVPVIENGVVV